MQAQIEFSLRDGTRLLRTCTLPTKSALDKREVLKTVNVAVVGLHVLRQAAVMALKGDKVRFGSVLPLYFSSVFSVYYRHH